MSLKTPRLDRCSTCWSLEKLRDEATNETRKRKIEKLLDDHQTEAFLVRDYIHNMFQKSKKQFRLQTVDESPLGTIE